jgi:hypothetical protein
VSAGRGDVVSGAGFDLADPYRVAARVGEHLDVPVVLLVFAGVPQVVPRCPMVRWIAWWGGSLCALVLRLSAAGGKSGGLRVPSG